MQTRFQRYTLWCLLIAAGVFCVPALASAAFERKPEVKVFDSGKEVKKFFAYDQAFTGGVQVAAGDMGGDALAEIVTAPGPDAEPRIHIHRSDGIEIRSFLAYDKNMRSGVNIAVGDLDGDGANEIVTAPRFGGTPHVRVFDAQGNVIFTPGFFAFDKRFKGGVNIAIGDINGDGEKEIIAGAGPGGGPQVRIFSRYGDAIYGFFPFHQQYRGGVSVAVANVDGGAEDEVVVGVQYGDVARVKVIKLSPKETVLGSFLAFPETFTGGIQVSGADVDSDGFDEIIAAAQAGGGPQVRAFEASGKTVALNFFAYEDSFRGGVNIATGDLDNDGTQEMITGPSAWRAEGRVDLPKYIEVDLSEQRLRAYENGRMIRTFLISSGIPGFDTPTGTFQISEKIYNKLYQGYYGPNSPHNFYLPNTKWNLRYDGARLLHGAYWHNSFGRRKSHGCINMPYPEAEWIYGWADIGTTVIVHQ